MKLCEGTTCALLRWFKPCSNGGEVNYLYGMNVKEQDVVAENKVK